MLQALRARGAKLSNERREVAQRVGRKLGIATPDRATEPTG
jgi:hypothetical protein